ITRFSRSRPVRVVRGRPGRGLAGSQVPRRRSARRQVPRRGAALIRMVCFAKVNAWTSVRTSADERGGMFERERARTASSAATVNVAPHTGSVTLQTPELQKHSRVKTGELFRTSVGEHRIPLPLATRLVNSGRRFLSSRRRAAISPELQGEGGEGALSALVHDPSRRPSPSLVSALDPELAGGSRIRTPEHAAEPLHSQELHIRARLNYAHRAGQQFRWKVQLPLAATGIIGMVVAIVVGVFSVVYKGPIVLSVALFICGVSLAILPYRYS
ncbi:hypothetical protein T492DRAFT_1116929, partial [Pavlovales sp. CCMP2436]